MKTVKLYDTDAYLRTFSATVLSVTPDGDRFDTVLDRTAFFPEAGGQTADSGTLGGAHVLDVRERDGVLHHVLDAALTPGVQVEGTLDSDARFEKMQCHSGEHILSGILHAMYGVENVGFHLGADVVTLDTSRPVSDGEIAAAVERANHVIFENLSIHCTYPSPDELATLSYRSKLDLTDGVRIVTIPGVDVCACCAPHVAHTGEIGSILVIAREKHKSGTRLTMLAGERARRYTASLLATAGELSSLLSAPTAELATSVRTLLSQRDAAEASLAARIRAEAERAARDVPQTDGDLAVFLPDATAEARRAYANIATGRVAGTLAVLTPTGAGIRYLLVRGDGSDIRPVVTEANAALDGRGGGRGNAAEGTFSASPEAIDAYFRQKREPR